MQHTHLVKIPEVSTSLTKTWIVFILLFIQIMYSK